ncbi:MAG TPA: hypothetical protein QGF02_00550 [Candidatus Babeliales bacterium]|nr:hypothetical protein [Candidatus Babeliales bacterium]
MPKVVACKNAYEKVIQAATDITLLEHEIEEAKKKSENFSLFRGKNQKLLIRLEQEHENLLRTQKNLHDILGTKLYLLEEEYEKLRTEYYQARKSNQDLEEETNGIVKASKNDKPKLHPKENLTQMELSYSKPQDKCAILQNEITLYNAHKEELNQLSIQSQQSQKELND